MPVSSTRLSVRALVMRTVVVTSEEVGAYQVAARVVSKHALNVMAGATV